MTNKGGDAFGVFGCGRDGEGSAGVKVFLDVDEEEGGHFGVVLSVELMILFFLADNFPG